MIKLGLEFAQLFVEFGKEFPGLVERQWLQLGLDDTVVMLGHFFRKGMIKTHNTSRLRTLMKVNNERCETLGSIGNTDESDPVAVACTAPTCAPWHE